MLAELKRANPDAHQDLDALEIRVAALSGKFDALLTRYQREPDRAPQGDILRRAAFELRKQGNAESARALLDYVYRRELEQDNPPASAFLGLAEVRLEAKDVTAAMSLLRRMNLITGAPFESLLLSARLMQRFDHSAEADEFLTTRLRAVPWDFDARLESARLKKGGLPAIAADAHAPYTIHAAAAGTDPAAAAARITDASARLRAFLDIVGQHAGQQRRATRRLPRGNCDES